MPKLSSKTEALLAHAAVVFLGAFVATFGRSAIFTASSLTKAGVLDAAMSAVAAGLSAVAHNYLGWIQQDPAVAPPAK